jgi:hypothetical protein
VPFCVSWIEIVLFSLLMLVTIPVMSSAKALDASMVMAAAPAKMNFVVPIAASRRLGFTGQAILDRFGSGR